MRKGRRRIDAVVGLFVLSSLALLLAVVLLIGQRQRLFEEHYEIIGTYNSVGGLQTGAEVHLAGIRVGHVKNIRFNPENRIEVVMSVSASQSERIRADSTASIRTIGLMGDRYVNITVGSEDEPKIADGGAIRTSELFEVSELMETARPALRNLENTIQNISVLTDQLADPESDVGYIIENVKDITTDVKKGEGTLGALLTKDDIYRKASGVLDTTQETMENLRVVSSNARDASGEFGNIADETKASISKIGELAESASRAAKDVEEIVDSGEEVMTDARVMASNLRDASEDIKQAASRIGPILDSFDESVSEAYKVIEAAKQSWLIRGYFEPAAPGEPIAVSGRDVAQPEVAQ